jgi:hypothetical protein
MIKHLALVATTVSLATIISGPLICGGSNQTGRDRQLVQEGAKPVNEWPAKSKRWALVIGVDDYEDPQAGLLIAFLLTVTASAVLTPRGAAQDERHRQLVHAPATVGEWPGKPKRFALVTGVDETTRRAGQELRVRYCQSGFRRKGGGKA